LTDSEIVGEKVKHGELHYLIRREDALEPAGNIVHNGLIKDWNNKVQALREKFQSQSGTKRPRDAGSSAWINKTGIH